MKLMRMLLRDVVVATGGVVVEEKKRWSASKGVVGVVTEVESTEEKAGWPSYLLLMMERKLTG